MAEVTYCLRCFKEIKQAPCYYCGKPASKGLASMDGKRLKRIQRGLQYQGTPWNAIVGEKCL